MSLIADQPAAWPGLATAPMTAAARSLEYAWSRCSDATRPVRDGTTTTPSSKPPRSPDSQRKKVARHVKNPGVCANFVGSKINLPG
jgi:hypothetical protein